MPENQREWIGITLNECAFQGIVTGDPTIVDGANGKCAFMNLRTIVGELAANGQWVDTTVMVPLVVMDGRKVEVIEKYVKDRRQLYVNAYYKAWKDGQGQPKHGLVVTKMKLGSKGSA
jgi:hypothetical protein